ncbi:hypothetical protein HRG_011831 [Hirsutella rhossiliensis]|uniref:Uncharacterized protein n=1 Tax=Hirsutella rhossiliensis TaxID=111463 RepID=A0A9P8MKZ6_9HYPO|nr:uncharacterized protein HRG_11831 [Hirsutella rhossiliensis]KAH0957083.1 hypothetical protein HRG_11831 [Hirsutella rhossiliensis]
MTKIDSSAVPTVRRTILAEPQDWDKWVKELRARVDRTIHNLVFSDKQDPLEPPLRLRATDFAEGATLFSELTSAQQRAFSAALGDYESHRKEYLYETKLLTAARTAITESVSAAKLISLREEETPRQ